MAAEETADAKKKAVVVQAAADRKSEEEAAAKEKEEAAAKVQTISDDMDDTEWLEEAEGILRSGQCSVDDFSVGELHRLQVLRARKDAMEQATEEQAAKKPKVYAGAVEGPVQHGWRPGFG